MIGDENTKWTPPLTIADLEFEGGRIVKVRGHRPEYLGGYMMIATIRDLAVLAADPDASHHWTPFQAWEVCQVCGVIRRTDRRNKPCGGPVKVGPR